MIEQWEHRRTLRAHWARRIDGYAVQIRLPTAELSVDDASFQLGLVVNEKPTTRVRRRGQLVLGGARGEFVYLRGDREDRHRLVTVRITSP